MSRLRCMTPFVLSPPKFSSRTWHITKDGLGRDRQLVRFAALLHDVGHAPFSHASEDLFPKQNASKRYEHEDYSVAIIRSELRSAIEEHQLNANYGLHAEDIATLVEGSAKAKQPIFWRDLISGQLDADKMDYLLLSGSPEVNTI